MRPALVFFAIVACLAPALAAPEKLDVPKDIWEPILFEPIDALARTARWTPLRQADLPKDALEVRVWIGFGLEPLQGIRLRREGDRWSAFHVTDRRGTLQAFQRREVMPRSNWKNLWQKVESLGILTLPDSSLLPDEVHVLDGTSYVVEISDGARYRTYRYGNPQAQKWEEARKIVAIVGTLRDELLERKP